MAKKKKSKKKAVRKPAAKRRPKRPARPKVARRPVKKPKRRILGPRKKIGYVLGGGGPTQGQAPHPFTRFKLINDEDVRKTTIRAAAEQPFAAPGGVPPALSPAKPVVTGTSLLPFGQSRQVMIAAVVDAKSVKFTMAVRDGTTDLPARSTILEHCPTGWLQNADVAELEVTYTAVDVTPGQETYTIDASLWWYDQADAIQGPVVTPAIVMATI